MSWHRSLSLALLLTPLLVLGACGGSADEKPGRGEVVSVDAARGQVTLDHEKIPGMMGAMTMTFDVADPTLLEGIEPGAQVDFTLRYAEGRYTVLAITPR